MEYLKNIINKFIDNNTNSTDNTNNIHSEDKITFDFESEESEHNKKIKKRVKVLFADNQIDNEIDNKKSELNKIDKNDNIKSENNFIEPKYIFTVIVSILLLTVKILYTKIIYK
jgi:hypothetical protein